MSDPMETAQAVKRHIAARDRMGKLCGVELLEVAPGRAVGRMTVRDELLNSVDTVHGGAVFTLADVVFAAACNSHGTIAVAASVSISYLRAARAGDVLTAEGVENSAGRRLGHYTITVRDARQQPVAIFQGTAYRKDDPLVPPAG